MVIWGSFPPLHVALGEWMAMHGGLAHNGFSALRGSISSWNVKYTISAGNGESQPVVQDVNGDGTPDIIFVNWFSCTVRSYNGATGALQWSRSLGGRGSPAAPSAGEVRPDIPGLEIAVSCRNTLYLLRGTDGGVIWSRGTGGYPAPIVATDGTDTLIISSNGTTLYAYNPRGTLVWLASAGGTDYHSGTPAVGDIDDDGLFEVVVRGSDGRVRVYDFATGTLQWSRYLGSSSIWSEVSLGDVTGDCVDEVIVPINSTIYVLNGADGTTLWSYNTGHYIAGPVSIADVNGDSLRDIIVGMRNNPSLCVSGVGVMAISAAGTPLWSRTGWTPNAMHGGGRVVADFDSDGQLEIAGVPYGSWCRGDGTFRMINAATGTVEWSYPYGVDAEGASMADVDGDMCAELMLLPSCCGTNNIVVLDGPATSCGYYPYNDTCGILVGDNDLSTEEKPSYFTFNVSASKGHLKVRSSVPTLVRIYSPSGSLIVKREVDGVENFYLKPGVYYVVARDRTVRVVIH